MNVGDFDGNTISNTTTGTTGTFDNAGVCVSPTASYGEFYLASSVANGIGCYSTIGDPTVTNGLNTSFIVTCTLQTTAGGVFHAAGTDGLGFGSQVPLGEISALQHSTYSLVYPSQTTGCFTFRITAVIRQAQS